MTVAAGLLVSFGVIFFPAMIQPSSLSSSVCSVLSNAVILGATGGSAMLVLSFVFISLFTSTSSLVSWVSSSDGGWVVSEDLLV